MSERESFLVRAECSATSFASSSCAQIVVDKLCCIGPCSLLILEDALAAASLHRLRFVDDDPRHACKLDHIPWLQDIIMRIFIDLHCLHARFVSVLTRERSCLPASRMTNPPSLLT